MESVGSYDQRYRCAAAANNLEDLIECVKPDPMEWDIKICQDPEFSDMIPDQGTPDHHPARWSDVCMKPRQVLPAGFQHKQVCARSGHGGLIKSCPYNSRKAFWHCLCAYSTSWQSFSDLSQCCGDGQGVFASRTILPDFPRCPNWPPASSEVRDLSEDASSFSVRKRGLVEVEVSGSVQLVVLGTQCCD